jgi:hypothetical protein
MEIILTYQDNDIIFNHNKLVQSNSVFFYIKLNTFLKFCKKKNVLLYLVKHS